MRVLVLGSAAGGGSPQWNCNCAVSQAVRTSTNGVRPRTQSSLAVSSDGENWFLLNASPDLGEQIKANPALHPKQGTLRHSPIQGVILTNGDVDHVAGLLVLRESQPLVVYGSQRVLGFLATNSIFNVLNPDYVRRQPLVLGEPTPVASHDGKHDGLMIEAFAVPGKIALWLEDTSKGGDFGTEEGDTIALRVWVDGAEDQALYYIPGCAAMDDSLAQRLKGAPLVFFDGTLWQDDEMVKAGLGTKTGARMGHMSQSGDKGTLAAFQDLDVKRKILIHINTTNPILLTDSPERRHVEQQGWEVAYDGMEVAL
ncbi:MAG: pyrroloquinoline quinone biosynthesis protein PqqB [Alphaproteobacteria bacterium GM202ARS2]|nr:pyrroloquinoline quinone biosynthesis protein PqqB [Alphaproteobacteria bacterium GM202ARS2]